MNTWEGAGSDGIADACMEGAADGMRFRLDESRWQAVVASLPPLVRARALNSDRTREFLEAVLWVATTHQPWGRLPASCGQWHSVYVRFTRWAHDGIWDSVIGSLASPADIDIAVSLRRLVDAYLLSNHPTARRAGPRYRLI